jgi:hypothetical protein
MDRIKPFLDDRGHILDATGQQLAGTPLWFLGGQAIGLRCYASV